MVRAAVTSSSRAPGTSPSNGTSSRVVAIAAAGIGVISTSSWPRLKATSTAAMPIAAPSISHAVRVTTSSAIPLPR